MHSRMHDIAMWNKKFIFLVIACGTILVFSTALSVGVVRFCVATDASLPLSARTLICGRDLNAERVGFKRLNAENMFIVSDTPESKQYSIDRGYDAAKLIDGNKLTLAAPANRMINYKFSFVEPQRIRQIIITWGDYGTIGKYVSQWKIEATEDGTAWKTIQEGSSPETKETILNKKFNAAALRLTAESPEDWIGVYEVEIVGRPL